MNSLSASLRRTLPQFTPAKPSVQFVRHESSTRRLTKKLRLHPHPSMKITSESPRQDHIIFNPPSSAPTPLMTPKLFLPENDPRRNMGLPGSQTSTSQSTSALPPAVRTPYAKSYHLTPTDFRKIRSLRLSNPSYWHRNRLAKEFNTSTLFIGMVCQAPESRLREMEQRMEKIKSRWGEKRQLARQEREKRRAGWGGADGL